jgi:hypothetical protein
MTSQRRKSPNRTQSSRPPRPAILEVGELRREMTAVARGDRLPSPLASDVSFNSLAALLKFYRSTKPPASAADAQTRSCSDLASRQRERPAIIGDPGGTCSLQIDQSRDNTQDRRSPPLDRSTGRDSRHYRSVQARSLDQHHSPRTRLLSPISRHRPQPCRAVMRA